MKDLPAEMRPREKLLAMGPGVLSDAELLALLLRTGLKGLGVLQMAEAVGAYEASGNVGALMERLSPAARRDRFHGAINAISAERVRQMSCVDQRQHVAFVVTAAIDGQDRIVADVRYVIDRSGTTPDGTGSAEFAVVVDEGWQRRGVGEHAMQTLMNTAGTAGLGWLHGDVLANNGPMLALMRSCRFCCTPDRDDDHLMRVETSLAARPERLLRSPHRGWRTWMPLWIGAGVASHA